MNAVRQVIQIVRIIRMWLIVYVTVCLLFCHLAAGESKENYMKRRAALQDSDTKFIYGQNVFLSTLEKKIDRRIVTLKTKEFDEGLKTGKFPPAMNFMTAKQQIEETQLFKILKRMPKGAMLHGHLIAMIDPYWLIQHSTYRPDCYMCVTPEGAVRFQISRATPTLDVCTGWRKVNDVRASASSAQKFDQNLRLNLTIITSTPLTDFPDINAVWQKADKTWPALADLAFFKEILPLFVNEVLRQYADDGVQYIETRGSLYATYDYDKKYSAEETLLMIRDAVNRFKQSNPSFIGLKFILEMAKVPIVSKEEIGKAVMDAVKLHRSYPDSLAGFDLVGQEDPNEPIIYYLDELLQPSQQNPPYELPYFFHAGETNWEGNHVDKNLYDALLLNATRIGHGYAAVKHTEILRRLKQQDVAVEVNPVSNQVLLLVTDLRNHPAAVLLANNFSVVLGSDDPGLWNALPLTHDLYELFMSCTPMTQGLNVLKRLALDSIRYSSMSEEERSIAREKWLRKWNAFIAGEILYPHRVKHQSEREYIVNQV